MPANNTFNSRITKRIIVEIDLSMKKQKNSRVLSHLNIVGVVENKLIRFAVVGRIFYNTKYYLKDFSSEGIFQIF